MGLLLTAQKGDENIGVAAVETGQKRETLGLSRHKVAVACEVTENTVTNWENGKHVPKLPPKQLAALLATLEWELQDLIDD